MNATDPGFRLPPPAPAERGGPVWPLWVVYAAGLVSGATILAGSVGASVAAVPAVAAASAVLFGMFGAVCAWLLTRIPFYWPVGVRTPVLAGLWGAFTAIGYALLANIAIYEHFADRPDAPTWAGFAPFTEEPIKDLGIVVVLLLAATRPRTALDGLVVGSFVGLGFEVVENVVQSLNNAIASAPAGHPGQWASLATDVIHEVLRRSWTGHIIITGIAGFGIGYALTARDRPAVRRWTVAAGLVLLALAAHLLWNSHRGGVFYVLGQFGALGVYLGLIRVGRSQEAKLYLPYLSYVQPGLIAPEPATRRNRRAAARLAAAIGNGDAVRAQEAAERLTRATG